VHHLFSLYARTVCEKSVKSTSEYTAFYVITKHCYDMQCNTLTGPVASPAMGHVSTPDLQVYGQA